MTKIRGIHNNALFSSKSIYRLYKIDLIATLKMYPKKDIKVKKVQSNNDPTKVRNMKHVNFVPKTIQTEVLYAKNRLCHFCVY